MVRDVHDYIMIHIRAISTIYMYLSHGNKTAFKASERSTNLNMKNNAETAMGQPIKSKKRFLQCQDPRTISTGGSML